MTEQSKQPICAAINDISGFGRCSLTVALPIISAMNIQCCPLPTAILSNHTGYNDYFFDDYTDKMEQYYSQWDKLNLHFDGIYTGFLGSAKQKDIVLNFIERFKEKNTIVIVDPVMGDDGTPYPTYSPELCDGMKQLVLHADIITPNITEACLLAGIPYKTTWATRNEIFKLAKSLSYMGPDKVVITGVYENNYIKNYIYEKSNDSYMLVKSKNEGKKYSGTGDVFSAIVTGEILNGKGFYSAVKKASDFIARAVRYSKEAMIPTSNGICFEKFMTGLAVNKSRSHL